jgi:hypothetical protein
VRPLHKVYVDLAWHREDYADVVHQSDADAMHEQYRLRSLSINITITITIRCAAVAIAIAIAVSLCRCGSVVYHLRGGIVLMLPPEPKYPQHHVSSDVHSEYRRVAQERPLGREHRIHCQSSRGFILRKARWEFPIGCGLPGRDALSILLNLFVYGCIHVCVYEREGVYAISDKVARTNRNRI